jgi:hypothetical protein
MDGGPAVGTIHQWRLGVADSGFSRVYANGPAQIPLASHRLKLGIPRASGSWGYTQTLLRTGARHPGRQKGAPLADSGFGQRSITRE